MAGPLLALLLISVYFPDVQQGAIPAIGAMLLVNWLLFQAPLAALEQPSSYLASVRDTFRHSLAATFFLLLGAVPAMIYLAEGPFLNVTPDSPLFLFVLLLTGGVGAILVYPYALWRLRRAQRKPLRPAVAAPVPGGHS